MKIQIAAPVSIHGMGKRANNEDNLFPPQGNATAQDNLFLVCDGVGGSEKGEVASEIACKTIPEYYQRNRVSSGDTATVHNAVAFAQAEIRRYAEDNPASQRMATTLTFLHLHENGATVAHIGDSRVYHIRNGAVLWVTRDHSYVNDLVKAGVITDEEARTHPRRNVIMRALQAGAGEVQADIHHIADLAPGDYFFLCSDGILESIDEKQLTDILRGDISDQAKMQLIKKRCEENSNDNFTAYLVGIKAVELPNVELMPEKGLVKKARVVKTAPESRKNNNNVNLWLVFLLVIICSGGYLLGRKKEPKNAGKLKTEQVAAKNDSVVPVHANAKSKKLSMKGKKDKQVR